MIDVKEAVKIATNFARDMFSSEGFSQITLEEIELAQDEPFWYITLGLGKIIQPETFDILSGKGAKLITKYKVFKVHQVSRQVFSMKIRKE